MNFLIQNKKTPIVLWYTYQRHRTPNTWLCIKNDLQIALNPASDTVEFFYNSLFSAKSWQNPANINRVEENKKIASVETEPTTSKSSLKCSTN